jgi:methyl-accepting chemotaxis protein
VGLIKFFINGRDSFIWSNGLLTSGEIMLNSIRTRLLAATILIVILSLLVNTFVNYTVSARANQRLLDASLTSLAESHVATIQHWVAARSAHIEALLPSISEDNPLSSLKLISVAGDFFNVFEVAAGKKFIASDMSGVPEGFDATIRPWYQEAKQAGKTILTNPYVDIGTGKLTVTVASPLVEQGVFQGVVGGDIDISDVTDNVRMINPTKHSFGMLIAADGTIIAHPDDALTLKPLKSISENISLTQLLTSKTPFQATISGREAYMIALPIPGTSWYIAIARDLEEAQQGMRDQLMMSALVTIVLIVLSSLFIHYLVRSSIKPLDRTRVLMDEMMDAIAAGNGDLTRRLPVMGNREVVQIASAFNRFVDKLAAVIGTIHYGSESVRSTSLEISQGTQELATRTETAAANLQQTSAALEEISATAMNAASAADRANTAVLEAAEVARSSGESIGEVTQTMNGIERASEKIGNIIGVIDGITFQTNILALNASVEAARAGEQGRGFAVVASEVRNLAGRSAEAAKEIRELVENTVYSVSTGVRQVQQASNTIQEVVDSVSSVTVMMSEISRSAQEQTTGINEINQAVAQLDSMVQKNAALVEASSASSGALQKQATELAQVVGQFKI